MSQPFWTTGIWEDMLQTPAALAETLERADGLEETAAALKRPEVRRIVAAGNGSSYYAALAMGLASLAGAAAPCEIVAVPAGLVADPAFPWRDGDALLAVSTSGEFRDLIQAVQSRPGVDFALVTAKPGSTLAREAATRLMLHIPEQRAVTHTHAYCVAALATLALWAELSDDDGLRRELREAPAACEGAIALTREWAAEAFGVLPTPAAAAALGSGPAWAGALEVALLVKEVARIPCEGVETREGATSVMTMLKSNHAVLTLPIAGDPHCDEAERVIAASGAHVLRGPGGELGAPRISPITVFPAGLALAVELAQRAGEPVDNPAWIDNYYTTARVAA